MALLEWNDELQVDVPKFDEQHCVLIKLLNDLHDAMKQGKGRAVIGEVLDELIRYTGYHFSAEETAFDEHGYPELHAHQKQHAELLARALELQEKHKAGDLAVTAEVLDFLRSWVTEHIKKCDKLYTAFFRENNITV
jgi:hemerythrin